MNRPLIGALAALLLLLAACGQPNPDDPTDSDDTPPPATPPATATLTVASGAAVDGPGISIAEALAQPGEELLINGMLLIDADGTAWLCSALAESFPPQCGGDRLLVAELDNTGGLPPMASGNGVRWSEEEVQLFGTVTE